MRQCSSCNVNRWLDHFKIYLTNLQTLEIVLSLSATAKTPTLGDSWIVRVFELQHGANGLRGLKIFVDSESIYPGPQEHNDVVRLRKLLRERIEEGEESA